MNLYRRGIFAYFGLKVFKYIISYIFFIKSMYFYSCPTLKDYSIYDPDDGHVAHMADVRAN